MSLIRNASLPFSAMISAADSRMRSKRSRLRCCVGTSRARPCAPAAAGAGPDFFLTAIPSLQKCLDELNTRVYRILQIRDILVFNGKEIRNAATSDPDYLRYGQDRRARRCAAAGARRRHPTGFALDGHAVRLEQAAELAGRARRRRQRLCHLSAG